MHTSSLERQKSHLHVQRGGSLALRHKNTEEIDLMIMCTYLYAHYKSRKYELQKKGTLSSPPRTPLTGVLSPTAIKIRTFSLFHRVLPRAFPICQPHLCTPLKPLCQTFQNNVFCRISRNYASRCHCLLSSCRSQSYPPARHAVRGTPQTYPTYNTTSRSRITRILRKKEQDIVDGLCSHLSSTATNTFKVAHQSLQTIIYFHSYTRQWQ